MSRRIPIALVATVLMSGWAVLMAAADDANIPVLKLIKTIPLGGEGRWDYIFVDSEARRLYVPRSTHTIIVDLDKGTVLGDIPSTSGVHGVALALEQNLGFTSNGKDDSVSVFDLKDFKVVRKIKTGKNPDAILFDPGSKRIITMNHSGGDLTVIDPAALDKEPVTIQIGGKLEFAVADGAGKIFVNAEDKDEIVAVDTKANKVLAHWPLTPAAGPTGLAIDLEHHRLFAGCDGKMAVADCGTGKVLATPAVGRGVDGVIFDATWGVAMSANGKDGTISVVKETTPGKFETVQTVKTLTGARTIALDARLHRALMPCTVPDGKGGQTFGIAAVGVDDAKK